LARLKVSGFRFHFPGRRGPVCNRSTRECAWVTRRQLVAAHNVLGVKVHDAWLVAAMKDRRIVSGDSAVF
jgi:hypothetical protein